MVNIDKFNQLQISDMETARKLSTRKDRISYLLLSLAGFKLTIHLLSNAFFNYGFFRDEFYYIACGEHLAWGYVDHPPLIALITAVTRALLGDSLFALRLFPAFAGAATVYLTGLIARELGGGRSAQVLAATAAIAAPIFLALNTILSMNAFDLLFWTMAIYLVALILNRDKPKDKLWYWLGIVLGFGLMNKITLLWFGFGLGVSMLLTSKRRLFLTREPWLAAAIAVGIFMPHIVWQSANGFPTIEFMRNATMYKMAGGTAVYFLVEQVNLTHPLVVPLWLLAPGFYFLSREGARFRILGLLSIVVLALLLVAGKSKAYYFAPAYPILLTAGAVMLERLAKGSRGSFLRWLTPVYAVLVLAGGIITAPLVMPVLPVERYIEYAQTLGLSVSSGEKHEIGKLHQFFADMHGWEEMVAKVAEVYHGLGPEERANCIIVCANYGEAGAIDFLGGKYGLPKAVCSHNNYWLWGPGERSGDVAVAIADREGAESFYGEVEVAGSIRHPYSMPFENRPVYLCRKPKATLQEVWSRLKFFI